MLMAGAWRTCHLVSYFVFILDCDLLSSKTCFWVTEIGTPASEETPLYEYTVFPQIIARGDFFFSHKKGRLFEGRQLFAGGDYFKFCSLEVTPLIFCLIIP